MSRKKNRLYIIFNSMHCRCEREQTHGYARYGGRGISVCEEWRHFASFEEWAYKNGYADNLTIDRIDNNKGYSPENCRWATREEQACNMRTNRNLTCKGRTQTLSNWAREMGISYTTISKRIEAGMSVEDAIFTPSKTSERPIVAINPITNERLYYKSAKEAERCGHTRSAIWRAITGEYKTHHGLIWKYATEV